MSTLRKNIISLFILQGANYLLPLATFPYLTRILGINNFGIYGVVITIAQYFVIFVDFGFNLTATKKVAINQNNKEELSKIFFTVLVSKSLLCIISLFLLEIFSHCYSDRIVGGLLTYSSFLIIGAAIIPVWFFQGIEKLGVITYSTIFARFLILPFIFFLVKQPDDVWIAIFLQSVVNIVIAIILIYYINHYRLISIYLPSLSRILKEMKGSCSIFIGTLAVNMYTMSTPIILSLVSNYHEVGIFSASERIRAALMGVFLILGNAIYPRVNVLYSSDKVLMLTLVKKIIIIQSLLTICLFFILFFFSDRIIVLLLGEKFIESSIILKIMSPLFFLITLSVCLCNYILLPFGYNKIYMFLPVFTAILNILISSLLGYYYGAVGSTSSLLLIEILVCLFLVFFLKKKKLFKTNN